jgi:hypothetical protein
VLCLFLCLQSLTSNVTVPAGHFYLAPGYMVSADNKIVAIENMGN